MRGGVARLRFLMLGGALREAEQEDGTVGGSSSWCRRMYCLRSQSVFKSLRHPSSKFADERRSIKIDVAREDDMACSWPQTPQLPSWHLTTITHATVISSSCLRPASVAGVRSSSNRHQRCNIAEARRSRSHYITTSGGRQPAYREVMGTSVSLSVY